MDLVDDQDDVAQLADLLDQALHPALELAPELGTRHQGGEVQQIDLLIQQFIGHLPLGYLLGQALGDGRFAHAGLTDETGVVFLAAVQDLDDPVQLPVTADEPVQLALLRLAGQGDAVAVQKLPLGVLGAGLFALLALLLGAALAGGLLGGGSAAEQLVQEGEGGGAAVVLLPVPVLALGLVHQALQALRPTEGGHHLCGQVVQVLVADAHLLHHIVNGLDAQLSGAFQA